MSARDGFILTRNWRDTEHGVELEYWLSTDSGPHRLRIPEQEVVFFLRATEVAAAAALLGPDSSHKVRELQLQDFAREPVVGVYFSSQRALRRARDRLQAGGLEPLEADVNPAERFLMERFIAGSLSFDDDQGLARVRAHSWQPELRMVSVDIETAMQGVELFSVGVYARQGDQLVRKVFMRGEGATLDYVESYPDERSLLAGFCDWLAEYDPDVLIGWNVVNFDLWFLQRLADKLGARLPLGRNRTSVHWRQVDDDIERRIVSIPGRVVLDGIDTLRTATYRFESFSLEYVSREMLGDGKLLHGSGRGTEIAELFHGDKDALAEYNLHDCELVWEIFEKTDLLGFAIARSQMTGLNMDRQGGSVAAFDFLYLPRLHRAGYVAPNASPQLQASPGGFVMDSSPGIYRHVLVLDFKSLYPSIIRTFCIDPLGMALALTQQPATATAAGAASERSAIEGFDGALFDRSQHLLPDIIRQLWQRRDEAKACGDSAQSQAIKIIMNSFYGVLGSPGCRFFDSRLASSITRRGHEIIQQTAQRIESLGERVIYGDTDSVFVWLQEVETEQQAQQRGRELQSQLNQWWAQRVAQEHGLECVLELEFETHYERFLMPTVRGSDKGSKKRYAGVVRENGKPRLIFKGLENVRTDWTRLARDFQSELYRRVFFDEPYVDYIKQVSARLMAGELDEQLVYRKRLRRQLDTYERNIPPHVQAARVARERGLAATARGDWIEYVITSQGAEPAAAAVGALDYQHYMERQLAPVADGVLHFLDTSFAAITGQQIDLF
jgi:DNA polymerase-2